ncbi:MAG: Fe-S cluster assembly protein SufD [Flavobacteriaceae bacterium]
MELKETLTASFLAFENKSSTDIDSSMHEKRSAAFERFEKKGFPTKKDENWKYTSLNKILKKNFTVFNNKETSNLNHNDVKNYFVQGIESFKLVFIDGVFSSFLSDTTHDGMDICVMSSALTKPKYKMVMDTYFDELAKDGGSLSDLNTAFAQEGAYINIPRGTVVAKPIQILNFSTGKNVDLLNQPRNLVVVGENAHVQIIERHHALDGAEQFSNSVTEIFANKRAIVDYYKIQNDKMDANLIDSTYVSQKRDSIVSLHTYSFGGNLTRNNLTFKHEGPHITSNLNGLSILKDKQHVDNHTTMHHMQPDCESNEWYKGLYMDKSTGVFNGKVIVDQLAQRTNAFQQNDSILLSDSAEINSKPQLEIFADDVKCSHGCTIGQLDHNALFYMQSRGIPQVEAQALLMYAFTADVLKDVKIPALKDLITELIAEKLGVDLGFDL